MSTEIKVPALPESVADALIATWHKQPGDTVKRDENLVDLETDKVVLEVPAPADGVLDSHAFAEGDTVTSGQVLGKMTAGEAAASSTKSDDDEGESESKSESEAKENTASNAPAPGPAVRALLEEHQLDGSQITGTGKDGRLIKGDVLAHIEATESAAKSNAKSSAESTADTQSKSADTNKNTDADEAATAAPSGERVEQRVPMTRMRSRIAERLVDSQKTTATLTTFNEVDLFAVNQLRQKYKAQFEEEHGSRLGFMSFFVKASIEALKRYPIVNASVDGDDIVYHNYFDVGLAVSSPRGLVVPIMRDADTLSFAEIEKQLRSFGSRAKDGKLGLDDLTGGTFSITNGGVFGSMMSTPILNPPQSAILGMHAIKERPMVVDGEVQIRPMMYLALSYDHRIIDGKEAVSFLVTIKECLEDPARLLLQL